MIKMADNTNVIKGLWDYALSKESFILSKIDNAKPLSDYMSRISNKDSYLSYLNDTYLGDPETVAIAVDSLNCLNTTRYTREEIEKEIEKLCEEYGMDYKNLSDMDDEQLMNFYNDNFIEEFGKMCESVFPKDKQVSFCFEDEE